MTGVMSVVVCVCVYVVTGGRHQMVPAEIKAEAERHAKEAIKDSDSEDED